MSTLKISTRCLTAASLAAVLLFTTAGPAFADKLSAKQAQATKVEAQLAAQQNKAELATEAYNGAREKYRALTVKVHSIEDQMVQVRARQDKLQTALNTRAEHIYRNESPLAIFEMLMSVKSIEEFNSTLELMTRVSQQDADTTAQLKKTTRQLTAVRAALKDAQAAAHSQQVLTAAKEKAAKAQVAATKKLLESIKADIRVLIAQRQAAMEAAARARYLSSIGSGGLDLGGNPPTSSKGAAAVWWAEKALGRPYEWAAAGPRTFDCSGLTMWAYAHVGISLPHHSGDQINVGVRVGRDHLQPGDLVFFGSPIHHVGMYVGGGTFIEAPYTGARVRFTSLSSRHDYAGACRP